MSQKVSPEIVRDPHLFAFFVNKGKFQVEEVYNFSQDDLLTEDILVLDTHAEVFVWVGHCADPKEKQNAFDIGWRYIEMAASLEGLSSNVPLYKVTEGNEPSFFTTYFSWDPAKASVQGNSFQKKVALLFGVGHYAVEERSNGNQGGGPTQRASAIAALSSAFNSSHEKTHLSPDRSNGSSQGGPTQRASALAALSSAFNSSSGSKATPPRPSGMNQGSQRAAAVAALSSVLTAEKKRTPEVSPSHSPPSEPYLPAEGKSETSEAEGSEEVSEVKDREEVASVSESIGEESEPKQGAQQDENASGSSQSTFSYDRLKAHSENPVTGIDFKRREAYLSEEEFQTVFGLTKEAFYKLPRWKQDMQKKKLDLF
uniref:HP domain-containing protein n=1 Tax=Rhizophora mucronata TaxID=61149 RepID=A0A2P2MLP7_RHIMU